MGIEPIANSLSPVESVDLTLLEDLIGAQKRGILRPSCAQICPSPIRKVGLADGTGGKGFYNNLAQCKTPHCKSDPFPSRGLLRN